MANQSENSDARTRRSRAAIVDSGITLLLQNPGASMSEIALAAGVGRATLYRHFETKEALVQEISMLCLQETEQVLGQLEMPESAIEQIKLCIVHLIPMANRYSFLLSLWSEASGNAQLNSTYVDQLNQLANMIEQAKREAQENGLDASQGEAAYIQAQNDAIRGDAGERLAAEPLRF